MRHLDKICKNCVFFVKLDDEKGECRRYAPRRIKADVKEICEVSNPGAAHFPEVNNDEWCGEFE